MGHRARCAGVLAIGVTVAAGAAAADLEGQSGPLAWRVSDVQQNTTTVDGKRHARHEFGLTLKNSGTDIAINGHDLTLLFDTGAQMCVLTPEAAKRVGVSAPAEGPRCRSSASSERPATPRS